MLKRRSLRDDEEGAVLIEFLLIFPIVFVIIVGAFHLGFTIAQLHSADKTMRAAVRYLARVPQPGIGESGWGLTRARNVALYGNIQGTGDPLISGWTNPNSISLATTPDPVDPTNLGSVRLTAAIPMRIGVLTAFGFGEEFTISVTHEERHVGG